MSDFLFSRRRLLFMGSALFFFFAGFLAAPRAQEPYDLHAKLFADFAFEIERQTALGQSVFVSGSLPELGAGDPTLAVRLSPRDFPVWRATVSLPRGEAFTYQYLLREDAPDRLPDPDNATPAGEVLAASTPPVLGAPEEVRVSAIRPHSFERGGTIDAASEVVFHDFDADGPSSADVLRLPRLANALWFLDEGPGGSVFGYPMRAGRTYWRSGEAFGYPPPQASLGASRVEFMPSVPSAVLGNLRDLRIYLPRGYDQNPNRVYPVLYMHDGQNIFTPGGPFGTWAIEEALDEAIAEGIIPELVVVGVDNTIDRLTEYVPPYSSIDQPGRGDLYARFLVEEVLPLVESEYRVATDAASRGVAGSSLGGLISIYIAWEYPDTFGRAASLSGSFQLREIIDVVASEPRRDIRIYLDSGNAGSSADGMFNTNDMRDALLANGYALERDLFHTIGYGDAHNESAWMRRFPGVLEAMFPASDFARTPGDVNGDGFGPDAGDLVAAVNLASGSSNAPAEAQAAAQADQDGSGSLGPEDPAALADVILGLGGGSRASE